MAATSTYSRNLHLDLILGTVVAGWTRPSALNTVYVGLYTTLPDSVGASGVEVTGGSYARIAVTNNSTNFPAASAGVKSIAGGTKSFTTATADWGTVVGFGIFDAVSGGNLLYHGPISPSVAIANTQTAQIIDGGISVSAV